MNIHYGAIEATDDPTALGTEPIPPKRMAWRATDGARDAR